MDVQVPTHVLSQLSMNKTEMLHLLTLFQYDMNSRRRTFPLIFLKLDVYGEQAILATAIHCK